MQGLTVLFVPCEHASRDREIHGESAQDFLSPSLNARPNSASRFSPAEFLSAEKAISFLGAERG